MKIKDLESAALLLLALGLTGLFARHADALTDLRGDYLGQPPPGETPLVFARGIVSTADREHWAPRFSPGGDEVFWWSIRQDKDDKWLNFHGTMRRRAGKWTAPAISPFDNAPIFSPDGKRLYFGGKKEGEDLTYVEKQENGWGAPKSAGLVSRFPAVRFAYFPSIAGNGTLYFMGYREGARMNLGIFRAELVNGEYAKPELLPPTVNTPGDDTLNWTPYIAPDESYLIFCSRRITPVDDLGDLYICFRRPDGSWTERISLGEPVNTEGLERFPAVSPDGRYLFFTRDTPGHDEDVYWVSAGIIGKLKAKAIREKRLKQ